MSPESPTSHDPIYITDLFARSYACDILNRGTILKACSKIAVRRLCTQASPVSNTRYALTWLLSLPMVKTRVRGWTIQSLQRIEVYQENDKYEKFSVSCEFCKEILVDPKDLSCNWLQGESPSRNYAELGKFSFPFPHSLIESSSIMDWVNDFI